MSHPELNRHDLIVKPLAERKNKVVIERDHVGPQTQPGALSAETAAACAHAARSMREARSRNASVMLTFGAHTIKNGLSPVLIELIERGWVTHLATNGAGIIHDWEFAYQGESSEDVRANVTVGQFGIWEETGYYINLAINVGAYNGLGYGESVGALVEHEGLDIPQEDVLYAEAAATAKDNPARAAAAIDLAAVIHRFRIPAGFMPVPHPFRRFGVQAAAYRMNVPFTGHPMFGHDIIYNHPMNCGAAIGRTAEHDFLSFANSVSQIEGGVYLSIGSAVMSPMVFEKSLSMAQNLAIQKGRHIDSHSIYVVDLAESRWDWERDGEPPSTDPGYYLRYCKTFSRMGGRMQYVQADNRDFLLALLSNLR